MVWGSTVTLRRYPEGSREDFESSIQSVPVTRCWSTTSSFPIWYQGQLPQVVGVSPGPASLQPLSSSTRGSRGRKGLPVAGSTMGADTTTSTATTR